MWEYAMKRITILALSAFIVSMAAATAPVQSSEIVTVHVSPTHREAKAPVGSSLSFVMDDLKGWQCQPEVSGDAIEMGMGMTNSIPGHTWYYFEAKRLGKSTVTFSCSPKSKSNMQAKRSIEIEVTK
jgi:hypothetical protein